MLSHHECPIDLLPCDVTSRATVLANLVLSFERVGGYKDYGVQSYSMPVGLNMHF